MDKVILYTIGCPKCKILEKKLNNKKINYEIISDKNTMIEMGMMSAPMLKVNDSIMDFTKAINWVKENYGD